MDTRQHTLTIIILQQMENTIKKREKCFHKKTYEITIFVHDFPIRGTIVSPFLYKFYTEKNNKKGK